MADELPLAPGGDWFADVHGPERHVSVSVREADGGRRVVLSIWRGRICRASFHLDALIEALTESDPAARVSPLERLAARRRGCSVTNRATSLPRW